LGWITGAAGIGLIIGTAPFISPAFRKYCLPYVPATPIQVSLIKEIFKKLPSKQKVIDLGSGDGRIVISLAKGGHIGVGVEVNYWLVLLSRFKSILNGVRKNTKFHWKNLWTVNLKGYDCVIIFGVEDMVMNQ
jgi:methylase of polypeptide subunit release factors